MKSLLLHEMKTMWAYGFKRERACVTPLLERRCCRACRAEHQMMPMTRRGGIAVRSYGGLRCIGLLCVLAVTWAAALVGGSGIAEDVAAPAPGPDPSAPGPYPANLPPGWVCGPAATPVPTEPGFSPTPRPPPSVAPVGSPPSATSSSAPAPPPPPAPIFDGSPAVDVFDFPGLQAAVADPRVRQITLRRHITFPRTFGPEGPGLLVGLPDPATDQASGSSVPTPPPLRGPLLILGSGADCAKTPFVDLDSKYQTVLRPDLCVIDAASRGAVESAQITASGYLDRYDNVSRHFTVAPFESLTLQDVELRHGVHVRTGGSVRVRERGALTLRNVHFLENTLGARHGLQPRRLCLRWKQSSPLLFVC